MNTEFKTLKDVIQGNEKDIKDRVKHECNKIRKRETELNITLVTTYKINGQKYYAVEGATPIPQHEIKKELCECSTVHIDDMFQEKTYIFKWDDKSDFMTKIKRHMRDNEF